MSFSQSLLLSSLLSSGLSGMSNSLNIPKGALASSISVFHEQSSSSYSSGFVLSTSVAVVIMLLLTIVVVSVVICIGLLTVVDAIIDTVGITVLVVVPSFCSSNMDHEQLNIC